MTALEVSAPRTREATGQPATAPQPPRPTWDKIADARPQVGTR